MNFVFVTSTNKDYLWCVTAEPTPFELMQNYKKKMGFSNFTIKYSKD